MKRIEAIIEPFKLEEVRDARTTIGVFGMTIGEVRGCGRRNGNSAYNDGGEYAANLRPKLKLEVVVTDVLPSAASAAILDAAKTGSIYDGSIFVSQLEEAIRIRTHETDRLAVC
jgi:nitrogen regulatory protein PII